MRGMLSARWLLFATLGVVIVLGWIYLMDLGPALKYKPVQRTETAQNAPTPSPAPVPQAPSPARPEARNAPPPLPSTSLTQEELAEIRSLAPDRETVRRETRDNPHATPKSLLRFANRLGPPMEKALKDPASAEVLAEELRACAWNENVAATARALCVSDTDRLAARHPQLRDHAKKTREGAAQEVVRLADSALGPQGH